MSFVAVSKVMYPSALKAEVHDIGKRMLAIAKLQDGLISVHFHQAHQKDQTMMYWEWESRAKHEACMVSEDWSEIVEQSKRLFETDGVAFEIETYERIA